MVKVTKTGQYVGEFRHNLTEKNRLALPKQIRAEIEGDEVVLMRGFEECIAGYDLARWAEMVKQPLAIPAFEIQGRDLRRKMFASARVIELDGQGRVVLPDTHLTWAKLEGKAGEEVVILGAGDHFEIWQKDSWEAYARKLFQ